MEILTIEIVLVAGVRRYVGVQDAEQLTVRLFSSWLTRSNLDCGYNYSFLYSHLGLDGLGRAVWSSRIGSMSQRTLKLRVSR